MKNLKFLLLALITIGTAQGTELYLAKINNQTWHKVQWEKLPLPGLLGKMKPVIIDRFGSKSPNLRLDGPTTITFTNLKDPKQPLSMKVNIVKRIQKRRPRPGEDPKKLAFNELLVRLEDTEGNVMQRWHQRINPNFRYSIIVSLKGNKLQKTEVEIWSVEIPTPAPQAG